MTVPSKPADADHSEPIEILSSEDFRSRTGRQRRARTSGRMLEALFAIVSEHGVRGLSVDTLRNAAGLSRGAFYNYYDTLEEFLADVSELLATIINEELHALLGGESRAIAQIADFARYFVIRATSDPTCAAILLRTLPDTSESMRRRMETTFSRAREAGEIDVSSVPHAVEISLGVLVAMLRLAVREGTDADQLSEETAILLRGLGVSKARASTLSHRKLPAIMDTSLRSAALARGLAPTASDTIQPTSPRDRTPRR